MTSTFRRCELCGGAGESRVYPGRPCACCDGRCFLPLDLPAQPPAIRAQGPRGLALLTLRGIAAALTGRQPA